MQIIIPMSGSGNRFREAGYVDPKPLIEVDGRPIIEHVVSMFPGESRILFICSEEHLATTRMRNVLNKIAPTSVIAPIKPHKLGPVHAVLMAQDYIDNDSPAIVSYCDYYAAWNYPQFKETMLHEKLDGCVPCYKGFHPHLLLPNLYAGVRASDSGKMLEIREKFSFTEDKMDTWQSSGAYYFKSGALIKQYFKKLMDLQLSCNNEYYVSMVYRLLIEDGLDCSVYPQEFFCQWGTPQDLEIYQTWSKYFAGLVGEHFNEPKR